MNNLKENFKVVEKATVTLLKKRGQGVLVNSNLILTAAHCIEFRLDGAMVLGDYYIEEIKTGDSKLKVAPLAVDPVSDLAVLGSLDDQVFTKETEDFEMFCKHTKPVSLCNDMVLFQEFNVHIYTHKGKWVKGIAMLCNEDNPKIAVETDEQLEGGTSGSPIINDMGELVAIASNSNDVNQGQDKCNGVAPCPYFDLPVWAHRRIYQ